MGPGTAALPDGGAAPARRRPRRPTGERPGRLSGRRGRPASRPRPWHPGPGDRTRHRLVPWGHGGCRAWQRASPGRHSCPRLAPRAGGRRDGRRGAWRGGRGRGPERGAAGRRRGAAPRRRRGGVARPGRPRVQRPPPDAPWRRCAARAPAGDPGGWSVGQAPSVPRVGASEAGGAGAGPGWPASPPARRRPGATGRRAAGRHAGGKRAWRVGPGPQGGRSWRGHAPARRASARAPSEPPAPTRGRGLRRPPRGRHDRGPRP